MDKGRVEIARNKGEFISTVSIYVADDGLPAVFRVSRHCHFYFHSVAPRRTAGERNENRFAESGSPSISRQRSRGAAHHLPPTSSFPPLFRTRSFLLFFHLIAGETDFSRVDLASATNQLSRVIDIMGEGMCVIAIETARFPIRSCATPSVNRRLQFRDEMME